MAIYSVQLRQSHDVPGITRRKWSNVVFFDAPNANAAAAAGVGLWQAYLRNAVRVSVFCYEVYATSLLSGDDDYTVQTVPNADQRGTIAVGAGEPYDPTVCVSVTIRASAGRPSRKFWRPGLWEGDVQSGQAISPALVALVEAAWNNALGAVAMVDPDGQALSAPVVARYSRRQLGRESAENLPAPPTVPE